MDTYFIRHTLTLNITDATREKLIVEDRIAIHYPEFRDGFHDDEDIRSLDPLAHDRKGGNILRRFLELGRNGGYVCAEYHGLPGFLVGVVEPGTEVELVDGRWRDRPGRVAILKTLRLQQTRPVRWSTVAAIAARPARGTLSKWPKAENLIVRLVDDPAADGAH